MNATHRYRQNARAPLSLGEERCLVWAHQRGMRDYHDGKDMAAPDYLHAYEADAYVAGYRAAAKRQGRKP